MRRFLFAAIFSLVTVASPLAAATTLEPTADGIAIRDEAYRDHLVYIILEGGTSRVAKAPVKILLRTVVFTDAANGQFYSFHLKDVNMPATLHVNVELIPQGLWMDEETWKLKDLKVRKLSPEEVLHLRVELMADLAVAKENYREAYTGVACGGKGGVAAELCGMNAVATADRRIGVIEAKARARR